MAEEMSARELRDLADEAESLERELDQMEMLSAEAVAEAANPIEVFCRQVWPRLKPILNFVLKIPLVPGGIKNTIRGIIRVCDSLCP